MIDDAIVENIPNEFLAGIRPSAVAWTRMLTDINRTHGVEQ
jgi:hypothetical protein